MYLSQIVIFFFMENLNFEAIIVLIITRSTRVPVRFTIYTIIHNERTQQYFLISFLLNIFTFTTDYVHSIHIHTYTQYKKRNNKNL